MLLALGAASVGTSHNASWGHFAFFLGEGVADAGGIYDM
jgi:hypothetical protein